MRITLLALSLVIGLALMAFAAPAFAEDEPAAPATSPPAGTAPAAPSAPATAPAPTATPAPAASPTTAVAPKAVVAPRPASRPAYVPTARPTRVVRRVQATPRSTYPAPTHYNPCQSCWGSYPTYRCRPYNAAENCRATSWRPPYWRVVRYNPCWYGPRSRRYARNGWRFDAQPQVATRSYGNPAKYPTR